jgi:peptide/nickel transport system ATP-binding protein
VAEPIVDFRDLQVAYRVRGEDRVVLRGLDMTVRPGESVGLVGESGCGKSTAALAAIGYLPANGHIVGGSARLAGLDLATADAESVRKARIGAVSMVYQDPGKALNPTIRIGAQVAEVYEIAGCGRLEAHDRTVEILRRVRIADPLSVMVKYPHQLSGGMQQRVCIAMALAARPKLLILDEPTTGLDATVEAEVLDLVAELRETSGAAILFISHNLAVVARMCDEVRVLYAGLVVESGDTAAVFRAPRHPYTLSLLRCIPARGHNKRTRRLESIPGFLPPPGAVAPGCVFAERCAMADGGACVTAAPPLVDIDGRRARCHHADRTAELAAAAPPAPPPSPAIEGEPALEVKGLDKTFDLGPVKLRALTDITLRIGRGETLGIVGESGSGKSTLAKVLLGVLAPDAGAEMKFHGRPVPGKLAERDGELLRDIQIVFQNPDSALNRSHSIRGILSRAIEKLAGYGGAKRDARLQSLLDAVRLTERHLAVKPRQLSGGQKQRVALARALAGEPTLVVCDEPTSALDVSVQAAILNLLADLQRERQVSYLFISHDLTVVRYLSDRIAVLYLGRLMETGTAEEVFAGPHHPYTEALLSSAPELDGVTRARVRLDGEIPSALKPPSGCVFHTRCPRRVPGLCDATEPALRDHGAGHLIKCHLEPDQLGREGAPAPLAAAEARPLPH